MIVDSLQDNRQLVKITIDAVIAQTYHDSFR